MAVLGNYLRDQLTTSVYKNTAFTGAATLYLALYTSNPNPDNSGTEASFTNYARVAISWGSVASHQVSNNANITFPAAGVSAGQTITYLAIFDALTSGNLYSFAPATISLTVNTGDIYQVSTGNLVASFQ